MEHPIDVVYTWVDGNDSKWIEDFQTLQITKYHSESVHPKRFRENGELFYSLLSINKFASWVRQIFIVKKPYQTPNLARLSEEIKQKIIFIDERQLSPPEINISEFYPTFNSLAVEANLHRIPGLSEHFIYFNNDMFLGRPLERSFFFKGGKSRISVKSCIDSIVLPRFLLKGHCRHIYNTERIFESTYLYQKQFKLPLGFRFPLHQCTPLHKSSFNEMWKMKPLNAELSKTSRSRVRNDDNLHAVYLSSLISKSLGKGFTVYEMERYYDLDNWMLERRFRTLLRKRVARFCINDGNVVSEKNIEICHRFFKTYFS